VTHDPYAPPKADSIDAASPTLGRPGQISPAEYERIRQRLQAMNRTSLLLGAPGLALQVAGNLTHGIVGNLVSLVGVGLLIAGLSSYARMRGHSAWYGALGLLSCLGMLILAVLPKKCFNCGATTKGAACAACGAPAPS
jgi:hypothetical protein